MTNREVNILILELYKLTDREVLELILKDKDALTKEGMKVIIEEDCISLVFTNHFIDEGVNYVYEFNGYGCSLLSSLFDTLGFKSDLV